MAKSEKNIAEPKKELLFLEPIKPELSVDYIFNNLMRVLKEKALRFILIQIMIRELKNEKSYYNSHVCKLSKSKWEWL